MNQRSSRREAIGRVVGAGLGLASLARAQPVRSPAVVTAGSSQVPTWKTELRPLAPNVYPMSKAAGRAN